MRQWLKHLVAAVGLRPFHFPDDTLAFRNETHWAYSRDPLTGLQIHTRCEPSPSYALRCFPMCRAVKLFFTMARFEPAAPAVGVEELRNRVRAVLRGNPRSRQSNATPVIFPGFANLREFSARHEALLKAEAGGAWRSYFQRGNWRMVLPFSRAGQEAQADKISGDLDATGLSVIHVFTFPALTLNHGVVVCGAEMSQGKKMFRAYDPNSPNQVLEMFFDREKRSFWMPPTAYFIGGPVNAYRIFLDLFH